MNIEGEFGGKEGIHWGRDKVKHRLEALDAMGVGNDPAGCDTGGGYPGVVEGIVCSAIPWLLCDRGDAIEGHHDLSSLDNRQGCVCEDVFELTCSCRGEVFHAAEIDATASNVLDRAQRWLAVNDNRIDGSDGLVLGCAAISQRFLDVMALHLEVQRDSNQIIMGYNQQTNRVMFLPKDSIVDFNFGGRVGRARWLQVVHGSVMVCMAPPSDSNLREFGLWYPTKDTCLSDFLDGAIKIELQKDDDKVLMVPTGWIIALVCQEPSVIVEGVYIQPDALEIEMKVAPHSIVRDSIHSKIIEDSCVRKSKALYWDIAGLYGDVLNDQNVLLASMVERKRTELVSYYYSCVSDRMKHPRLGIPPEGNPPSSNASLNLQKNRHDEPEKNTAESPRSSLKIKLSRSPRTHLESPCPSPKKIRLRLPDTSKEKEHDNKALDTHRTVELIDEHTTIKLPLNKSKRMSCLRQLCVILQQYSLMQCVKPHALDASMKSLAALIVCAAECRQNAPMTRDCGSTIFSKQPGDVGCMQILEDEEDKCEHCDETPKATEMHTPFSMAAEKFDDEAHPKHLEKSGVSPLGNRAPATKKHASAKQRLAKKLGIKA
ncbi:hypothetical protein M9435_006041 [Picochlorum sp. BPE23]|nr:hypothetical protein M9435_006041 [Picochlorum sp. BPE23]